ncbi:hypothetical protein HPT25_16435 [Bacillus sp. BRMEA1]|uniref:hypothetical protein n=1 Tax=Neobacillus endophyticus TaxID=2738405 RepID=UPI001563AB4D|nr:hypothetical protein [Neobacillus endophyticus]NRD78953.1 hypothetical protein [Neobacillus endophyticus]
MKKFNDWLAEKITIAFYSMWAFYVFFIYGLIPLKFPFYEDKILYWSNFVQLIALPAIGVGAVVLAKKHEKTNQEIYEAQEKRAQEIHDSVMEELKLAKEDRQELTALVKYLHEKLERNGS